MNQKTAKALRDIQVENHKAAMHLGRDIVEQATAALVKVQAKIIGGNRKRRGKHCR
ncbi:MAG: hypothetical protein L0Z50_36605 [Verrucomicrobiales bacterium]|nr:hypothetical protein [Verrucomicrobiales bacterium]